MFNTVPQERWIATVIYRGLPSAARSQRESVNPAIAPAGANFRLRPAANCRHQNFELKKKNS